MMENGGFRISMKRITSALVIAMVLVLAGCNRDPKVQAQQYVDKGKNMFEKGKFKEASIMYRQALKKDARYGEAYYRLGLTEIKLERWAEAVRALQRAVELLPDNEDAKIKLADIYLLAYSTDPKRSKAYLDEIRELTDKLLKRNPKSFDGLRLKGYVAQANQDLPGALEAFEAAFAQKPLQPELTAVLFQARVSNNKWKEAEELAWQLIGKEKNFALMYDLLYIQYAQRNQIPDAEKVLRKKVENNPTQSSFRIQLADHYRLLKQQESMEGEIAALLKPGAYPLAELAAGDFFLTRARDVKRSQQLYEQGIQNSPKEKAVYQKRLVELFSLQGKFAEATQMAEAILKDNKDDKDAIALRAALGVQTGKRDEIEKAAKDLQELVVKDPKNAQLRFNLARALLARGDLDLAKAELDKSIEIRKDFLPAREALSRLYLRKGDPGRAIKEAEEILKQNPNFLSARLIKSSALLSMNDRVQARTELDLIAKQWPDNPEAKYQMGFLEYMDRNFKTAEEIFSKVSAANPNDARGRIGSMEALAAQGRYDEAMKLVKVEMEREPNQIQWPAMMAALLVRAERFDDAIKLYHEIVAKNPKASVQMFRLGETYRRKGDLNSAIEWLRKASAENPNDPGILLQLGLLLEGTGKRDQARPLYEQVLKVIPDEPTALNNLAYMKAEDGEDLDTALSMANRAREKRPKDPNVADTLGWVYVKKNLNDDAIRLLADAVKADPKNGSFRYHYGVALLQKGDRPRAKQELELALRNNPPRLEAEKIRTLLASN